MRPMSKLKLDTIPENPFQFLHQVIHEVHARQMARVISFLNLNLSKK